MRTRIDVSRRRGGLRELMEKSRGRNLTITPDGPRGPRRKFGAGPDLSGK